ncbi:MAG: AEC family transporter [Bacteroidales bacterium]|jgi:predicted permease|nr:AEC family transporter [Bacteroidales bacterium]
MQIIFSQIAMLLIMSIIGAMAYLIKLIGKNEIDGIVKLVTKITLPLLIFTTFASSKIDANILKNGLIVAALSALSVVLFFIFSSISARILKLDKKNRALHRLSSMFGNVVFLGFPVIDAVFPSGEGLIYATMFHLGQDALMWTWGVFILNKANRENATKAQNPLQNPITLAFIAGIIFMLLPFQLPEIIFTPLSSIGKTTTYVSMIYVGTVLAMINPLKVFLNLRSYVVSFNKLILVPFIILALFKFTSLSAILGLNSTAIGVVILQAGMPSMILISLIVKDANMDYKQATENIFLSTLLSFASISLLFYLL